MGTSKSQINAKEKEAKKEVGTARLFYYFLLYIMYALLLL